MTESDFEIQAMDEQYQQNLMRAEAQVEEVALEMKLRENEAIIQEARAACMEAVEDTENSIQSAREQYHNFTQENHE